MKKIKQLIKVLELIKLTKKSKRFLKGNQLLAIKLNHKRVNLKKIQI